MKYTKMISLHLRGQQKCCPLKETWYYLKLKMKEMFNENVEDIEEFGN